MNCDAARELLLTAEPGELEGRVAVRLAEHLAGCNACRAAADRLVGAQRELRQALEAAPSSHPATEAAREAMQSAEQRRIAARRVRLAVPLAAAAVLAGLLLARRAPAPAWAPPVREALPARFSVTAPAGRNVVVLQPPDTSNVIVVWFF